jgi:hypothetical protein
MATLSPFVRYFGGRLVVTSFTEKKRGAEIVRTDRPLILRERVAWWLYRRVPRP